MLPRHLHRLIARLALAWFALALGMAAASPLVQPRSLQLVCSAAGAVKLLVDDGDGLVEAGHTSLDCALCLLTNTPPAPAPMAPSAPLVPVLQRAAALPPAPVLAATWAPLPARGPPTRT